MAAAHTRVAVAAPVMQSLPRAAMLMLSGLLLVSGEGRALEIGQKARQRAEMPVRKMDGAEAHEKLLQEARDLIRKGSPAKAYAMLEPVEFDHAGEERFDYLIGIAALDSGKPDRATLAFERLLAVNPGNTAARLDLARAYFQLGDFQRAKTEFSAVLEQNPSGAARASIGKYLDAIDAQKEQKRTHFTGYIEGVLGRDNNVNLSTSQSQVFVDLSATMATLDASNVKVADNYYSLAAGGEVNHELNANWGLFAGGEVRKRGNAAQTEFDSVNTDVRAGLVFDKKADRLRVGVLGGQYNLGGSRNSGTSGIKGEWRRVFSPGNQLNAFAQSVKYRYIDLIMQPNDFDQRALGLGWLHVNADGESMLSGGFYFGNERDVAPIITVPTIGPINPGGGRNDGAKRFGGLRVGGQMASGEKTTLFASAGFQKSEYDRINYLFLRKRLDRLVELKLGANWRWDRLWALRPQLNHSRNMSNIGIYGYIRTDISLTIRRDLR